MHVRMYVCMYVCMYIEFNPFFIKFMYFRAHYYKPCCLLSYKFSLLTV